MNAFIRLPHGNPLHTSTCKRKEYRPKNRPLSARSLLTGMLFLAMLSPLPARAAEIMATLPPLAGVALMLQPDAAPACLLPASADPHHFQLSPKQIESLRTASMLIRATRDDGAWPHLPTQGKVIDLWNRNDHAWLSPEEVRNILPRLADELAAVAGPEQARQIHTRLHEAQATATAMGKEWQQALAPLKARGVIVQHPSWRRLLDNYGVPVHAVLEAHDHAHESGPHMLEHALEALQAHPDAWLLGDRRHNNRSLEWLARQSGKQILYLDALGQCGDSWQLLMQQNLERLRAFKP